MEKHPAVSLIRIGTAGWTIPRAVRGHFPGEGSHLALYGARFRCAEINSSFYRQHKPAVYARWAASVPDGFRFSVKVPRAITHDQMLVAADVLLDVFLDEVRGLGDTLGALLVQLPASHAFVAEYADDFFTAFRARHAGVIVCEPRHASWFDAEAEDLLVRHRVARAAADPACVAGSAVPGGWRGITYRRLHGSPRIYWSSYPEAWLAGVAAQLREAASTGVDAWCILDNTASGAAAANALTLQQLAE